MNQDTDLDYRARLANGRPHRYSHEMTGCLFKYMNELADMADTERLPKYYEDIYDFVAAKRKTDVMNYKKINIEVNEKENGFVVL